MSRLGRTSCSLLLCPGVSSALRAGRTAPLGVRLLSLQAKATLSTFPSDAHRIYLSDSTDPWFNLAYEDWLYRKSPSNMPLLFLYRNEQCVVLGRNQNPWKELNLPYMEEEGIPFVRRRSGGGTVYHDLGNTNYSIMVPKDNFDRRPNAELVARALNSLGVDAVVNERSDITLQGSKMSPAYKLNNRRAYHHGTMLLSTDLSSLGDSLRSNRSITKDKATASVRSPVRNISSLYPMVSHDSFVNAVCAEFTRTYGDGDKGVQRVSEGSLGQEREEIFKEAEAFRTWQWAYGQTPEFSMAVSVEGEFGMGRVDAIITSKHGVITGASLTSVDEDLDLASIQEALVGLKLGTTEVRELGIRFGLGEAEGEVFRWLRREI